MKKEKIQKKIQNPDNKGIKYRKYRKKLKN